MSRAVSTAAPARIPSARKWVSPRRWSDRNRSTISSANVAPQRKISGASGARSARVGIGRAIRYPLQLGGGELRQQLGDGGFHQVGQRLRIDAERQREQRERAEHPRLAPLDEIG